MLGKFVQVPCLRLFLAGKSGTICPSEAANALANAETLPPPGVAVGGRRNRETVVPALSNFRPVHPLQACRSARGQFIFEHLCRRKVLPAAEKIVRAISIAFFGTNRTISLLRASRHGVRFALHHLGITRCIGVLLIVRQLIDT